MITSSISKLLSDYDIKPTPSITDGNQKQRFPLLCWNFYIESFHFKTKKLRKQLEFNYLNELSEKYQWQNDLQSLFEQYDYEALILTDTNQNIIWVNEGFTTMTGYPKNFALNKNPKFLQGPETSQQSNFKLKTTLKNNEIYSGVLINYKKDQSIYNCEVKIIPLYNDKTTHYLAFEREVV